MIDSKLVDAYLTTNASMLPEQMQPTIRQTFLNLTEDQWSVVQSVRYKDPVLYKTLQFFGIGNLLLGKYLFGILQIVFFTFCFTGLAWAIFDALKMDKEVQTLNLETLNAVLSQLGVEPIV